MQRICSFLSSILYPLSSSGRWHGILIAVSMLIALPLTTGCYPVMADKGRIKPFEPDTFFADGRSARSIPPNTVAVGQLRVDRALYEGKNEDGSLVDTFPIEITREVMDRGHQQFDVFCSPCHGRLGNGQGMIVQRGFKAPPSFHTQRLRDVEVGHFYDVMTNGFGVMYSYASRISPEDRWAIAAYIRALQLSQNATLEDVPPGERDNMQTGPNQ